MIERPDVSAISRSVNPSKKKSQMVWCCSGVRYEVTEVVAAAGLAKFPRREYWVGTSTVAAIVAQKFIPGVLDQYLGKTGYKAQQIEGQPRDPNTPNNLYDYVPGIHSTRGKFEDRSKRSSAEVYFSLHREWLVLGALAATGLAAAVLGVRRRG